MPDDCSHPSCVSVGDPSSRMEHTCQDCGAVIVTEPNPDDPGTHRIAES